MRCGVCHWEMEIRKYHFSIICLHPLATYMRRSLLTNLRPLTDRSPRFYHKNTARCSINNSAKVVSNRALRNKHIHRPKMSAELATSAPHLKDTTAAQVQTSDPTALIESAKKAAAQRAVDEYFDVSMRWVGIGSGTTIQYVVEAIKEKAKDSHILFVPTGFQSRNEIEKRGLIAIDFSSLPENTLLDVAFDGADEVDEEFNCIKGGGACLFQEKLVAMRAKKFVCVAGS